MKTASISFLSTARFVCIEIVAASAICGVAVAIAGGISDTSMRVGLTFAGLVIAGGEIARQFPRVPRTIRHTVSRSLFGEAMAEMKHSNLEVLSRREEWEIAAREELRLLRVSIDGIESQVYATSREILRVSHVVVQLELRLSDLSDTVNRMPRLNLSEEPLLRTWWQLGSERSSVVPFVDQLVHDFSSPRYSPWFEHEHFYLFQFDTPEAWLDHARGRRSIVVFMTNTAAPSLREIKMTARSNRESASVLQRLAIELLTQLRRGSGGQSGGGESTG